MAAGEIVIGACCVAQVLEHFRFSSNRETALSICFTQFRTQTATHFCWNCSNPGRSAVKTYLSAVVLALLLPAIAHADDPRPAVRAACKADVKSNCGMVFSRDKALACLIDNAAKLSSPCTAALKTAACNSKAPDNVKAAFPCTQ
jgi:hypothetical protein